MLNRITPANVLPVSLADAKRYLGVSSDDRDLDVETLVRAAANVLVNRTGRALTQVSLQLAFERWPCNVIELPYTPPLGAITAIQYWDSDGVQQTVATYQLAQPMGVPAVIRPAAGGYFWPTNLADDRLNAITIDYTAGSDDLDLIPDEARLFILEWCRWRMDHPDGEAMSSGRGLDTLARSLWVGDYVGLSAY